jgi:hypothetical protein
MWELVGAGVARILFGSAPGREGAGEPTAAAKIARLKTLGPDGKGGRIDLTSPPAEPAGPRSIPAG